MKCRWRVVASFLPYDIECVLDEHKSGAHRVQGGGVFLITDKPKPPPVRKRRVRVRRSE